jgi:hypothetical protein
MFPTTLVVMSVLLLVLTVIRESGQPPAWKSSILPFHHFLDLIEGAIQHEKTSDLEKSASTATAQLYCNKTRGWHLNVPETRRLKRVQTTESSTNFVALPRL